MKAWQYLVNPFLVATNGSYRTAKKLGDFTVAALTAHPGAPFTTMLDKLLPLSQTFNDVYAAWTTQRGLQKGKTSGLQNQLRLLSGQKIEDWDIAIQQVYKQDTPQYVSLLPNRRIPFQRGSQENRINAVDALSRAISTDVALQTVKTDIDDFFTSIKLIYTSQKGSKSVTGNNSDNVEAARIAVCVALYGVLGQLMDHFKETPEAAASFFDVETLRNRQQDTFKSNIKAGETRLVLTNTFKDGEQVRIINRGNTDIGIALVAEKNDALPSAFTSVTANNEITVDASTLGNITTNRFLIAKNLNAAEGGAFTAELL